MTELRAALLAAARDKLSLSMANIDQQLTRLQQDQSEETKSSAGDKFETSREMMQQQMDQLEAQGKVLAGQLEALARAERKEVFERVAFGSCLQLATGEYYLLACGIGKLTMADGALAHAISPESPLGEALLGARAAEQVTFRDRQLEIAWVG